MAKKKFKMEEFLGLGQAPPEFAPALRYAFEGAGFSIGLPQGWSVDHADDGGYTVSSEAGVEHYIARLDKTSMIAPFSASPTFSAAAGAFSIAVSRSTAADLATLKKSMLAGYRAAKLKAPQTATVQLGEKDVLAMHDEQYARTAIYALLDTAGGSFLLALTTQALGEGLHTIIALLRSASFAVAETYEPIVATITRAIAAWVPTACNATRVEHGWSGSVLLTPFAPSDLCFYTDFGMEAGEPSAVNWSGDTLVTELDNIRFPEFWLHVDFVAEHKQAAPADATAIDSHYTVVFVQTSRHGEIVLAHRALLEKTFSGFSVDYTVSRTVGNTRAYVSISLSNQNPVSERTLHAAYDVLASSKIRSADHPPLRSTSATLAAFFAGLSGPFAEVVFFFHPDDYQQVTIDVGTNSWVLTLDELEALIEADSPAYQERYQRFKAHITPALKRLLDDGCFARLGQGAAPLLYLQFVDGEKELLQ